MYDSFTAILEDSFKGHLKMEENTIRSVLDKMKDIKRKNE